MVDGLAWFHQCRSFVPVTPMKNSLNLDAEVTSQACSA